MIDDFALLFGLIAFPHPRGREGNLGRGIHAVIAGEIQTNEGGSAARHRFGRLDEKQIEKGPAFAFLKMDPDFLESGFAAKETFDLLAGFEMHSLGTSNRGFPVNVSGEEIEQLGPPLRPIRRRLHRVSVFEAQRIGQGIDRHLGLVVDDGFFRSEEDRGNEEGGEKALGHPAP